MAVEIIALGHLSHGLDQVLDLRAAAGLKERLLQLLGEGRPLTIDASRVARISTACIQVIIAFVIAARHAGLPLTIAPTSTAFDAAFAGLGLDGVISERPT